MAEKSGTSLFARLLALLAALYMLALMAYLILRLVAGDSTWWVSLMHNFAPYYFLPVIIIAVLMILIRARRLLAWSVVLLLIGAIWFLPPTLPKSVPAGDGLQLHIVTFNIYPDNVNVDDAVAWIQEQKPFIVAIQEVNGNIREQLTALDDDYPYRVEQGIESRARTLYSRLPVLENSEIDTLNLKHQRVVIDMNGREIALYNVHLDMPADSAPQIDAPFLPGFVTHYNVTKRNQQIRALLEHLETEALPYIVMGDFNMSDHDPIYGEIAASMTDAFRSAGSGFGLTWPAGDGEELNADFPLLLRLDYVWYSQSIRALSAMPGPVLGSDHLPLSVVVEIAR